MNSRQLKVLRSTAVVAMSSLLLAACGGDSSSSPRAKDEAPAVSGEFASGQSASVVIGQPDFTSNYANQDGAAGLQTMDTGYGGAAMYNGNLYVPDLYNNRILVFSQGIPEVNGEAASFVIGQTSDSETSSGIGAGKMNSPTALLIHDDKLVVADWQNNRVLIWNQVPTAANAPADLVLGQPTMNHNDSACSAAGMNTPAGLAVFDGKLLVSDTSNHRILVWNTWPTINGQAADAVLGQDDLVSCTNNRGDGFNVVSGRGFNGPVFIWSDGVHLAVPDQNNNRVLLWNQWPGTDSDMVAADVVLGQADFVSYGSGLSASAMNAPQSAMFDGTRLFVSDSNNNRVLIWNSWPDANTKTADVVLGQPDFETNDWPDAGSDNFSYPGQAVSINGKLLVPDWDNSRIMIFE